MLTVGAPAITVSDVMERARLVGLLAEACGLPAGEDANHCSRTWCGYFEEGRGRCGLLVWDVPMRLGPEALRWFAVHRVAKSVAEIPDADSALRARICSF